MTTLTITSTPTFNFFTVSFFNQTHKLEPAMSNLGSECRESPRICHSKADCSLDGICICITGYKGDGIYECSKSNFFEYFIIN